MIYAPTSALSTYTSIPCRDTIADFLRGRDLFALPDGEHEIEGRNLYLRVFTYDTPRDAHQAQFEAHRHDADLHVVLRGVERIQTVAPARAQPTTPYDEARDIQFFTASESISDVILGEWECVFFLPGELHKPMCFVRVLEAPVKKFCFKIRML